MKKTAYHRLLLVPFVALVALHFACKPSTTNPTFKDAFGGYVPPGATATLTPAISGTVTPGATSTPTVSSSVHTYSAQWGTTGILPGQFLSPHFLAVDDVGNIFVSDYGNQRIQSFTSGGVTIAQWACAKPQGIAVDNGGNLLVADESSDAIQIQTKYGGLVGVADLPSYAVTWVDSTPATQVCIWHFKGPVGVAINDAGDYIIAGSTVADSGTCPILYDFFRNVYVDHVSPHVATNIWDSDLYSFGDTTNLMGVACNSTYTKVYFVDTDSSHIIKIPMLNSVPQAPVTYGSKGSGVGTTEFEFPHGIAVNAAGHVFVADSTNNRIQEFDDSADTFVPVGQFGTYGSGPGQFKNPWGVTVDNAGYIYVVDSDNNRIQKFSP